MDRAGESSGNVLRRRAIPVGFGRGRRERGLERRGCKRGRARTRRGRRYAGGRGRGRRCRGGSRNVRAGSGWPRCRSRSDRCSRRGATRFTPALRRRGRISGRRGGRRGRGRCRRRWTFAQSFELVRSAPLGHRLADADQITALAAFHPHGSASHLLVGDLVLGLTGGAEELQSVPRFLALLGCSVASDLRLELRLRLRSRLRFMLLAARARRAASWGLVFEFIVTGRPERWTG
jgi:hypothetical protein